MSTKRLARTVIEGGRTSFSKEERRRSHHERRIQERVLLRELLWDPEVEREVHLDRVPKYFADRLSAAERWLRGHTGKPWRDVEGLIYTTFDLRSLAGRHIVFGHLLPREDRYSSLRGGWRVARTRGEFFVDDADLLQFRQFTRRRYARYNPRPLRWEQTEHGRWVGGRLIAKRGRFLYWLEPTTPLPERTEKRWWLVTPQRPQEVPRRQSRALTSVERATYAAFQDEVRALLTVDFEP
jgi:hypothetical protein